MVYPREPLNIGIVSTLDLNRHGGLETYVRLLTGELVVGGETVSWNGQTTAGGYQFDPRWSKLNQRLLSVMTRRRLRWMSRRVAESIGQRDCRQWLRTSDVMHYVGTGWNLLGFPAARSASSLGLVRTCWPAIHPGQWGDHALDFDLYAKMDAIFVQSDVEKQLFQSRGIAADRLVRCDLAPSVPTTGDRSAFLARHHLHARQLVLFVGRKCRLKGYHAVRQAVAMMVDQGRPVTLVTIGSDVDGPYPALPREADLDLGRVDDQQKGDALAACDVLALPSSVESFGIVYTEAWAYAKPVVCGPSPASQELVTRYGGGIVGSNEPKQLAATLNQLLDSDTLRAELGRAGHNAVRRELSWPGVARRHRETWARLAQRSRQTTAAGVGCGR